MSHLLSSSISLEAYGLVSPTFFLISLALWEEVFESSITELVAMASSCPWKPPLTYLPLEIECLKRFHEIDVR